MNSSERKREERIHVRSTVSIFLSSTPRSACPPVFSPLSVLSRDWQNRAENEEGLDITGPVSSAGFSATREPEKLQSSAQARFSRHKEAERMHTYNLRWATVQGGRFKQKMKTLLGANRKKHTVNEEDGDVRVSSDTSPEFKSQLQHFHTPDSFSFDKYLWFNYKGRGTGLVPVIVLVPTLGFSCTGEGFNKYIRQESAR